MSIGRKFCNEKEPDRRKSNKSCRHINSLSETAVAAATAETLLTEEERKRTNTEDAVIVCQTDNDWPSGQTACISFTSSAHSAASL